MLKFQTITAKNFLSIGNQTQAVNLDRRDLTLVLGENLDMGGDDSGHRNGVGKTAMLNALSYALYGQALTNIKRDNLINKTNAKGMLVTVEFENNGVKYKIERGRKPNVLRYIVGDVQDHEQEGDSRETQAKIERMLGIKHDMFKHLVALNTYTQPFLGLGSNDQRAIIEQLLGITLLSTKAETLKEQLRHTKDLITEEEYKIKASQDANERIKDQIKSSEQRQKLWKTKHNESIQTLETAIRNLDHLDIHTELDAHNELTDYQAQKTVQMQVEKDIAQLEAQLSRGTKDLSRTTKALQAAEQGTCSQCDQDIHHLDSHKEQLQKAEKAYNESNNFVQELQEGIESLKTERADLPSKPNTFYDNINDAHNHKSSLSALESQLQHKRDEHDPYIDQIKEMNDTAIQEVDYNSINQLSSVRDHQEFLLKLLTNKDSYIRKRIIDQNLQFLNARLTHYLNKTGLPHTVKFLNDLNVEIQDMGRDLDFDNLSRGERNRLILSLSWAFRDVWENLYNPINILFIDEVIDSGMDSSGVENALAVLKGMARERNKSIWLISHKDELSSRVNNILSVVKENGFTSFSSDLEISS